MAPAGIDRTEDELGEQL